MRLIRLDGSTTWSSQSMLGVHIIVLSYLTLCMLGTFVCFLSSADFFFKINVSKIFITEYNVPSVSTGLDPEQARHFKLLWV